MPENAKMEPHAGPVTSRHSTRLQALSDEAADIRQQHLAGKLTSEEAAEQLECLNRRHVGFLERLIDL